jgi:hypothetical protein
MEMILKKKRGRKLGSTKPAGRRRVMVTYSVAPEVARAVDERIDPGERSMFIERLIRQALDL